ncbi:MAG: hypothetical protein OEZ43_01475 [Gammaproteobacteria bacterium]|nr:hypothetical protein [Gammaproteobacteria bacterium]
MSKRLLMVILVGFFMPSMAFAIGEGESPAAYCAEEARDVGLVDASEIRAYVEECVQLIAQESGENAAPAEQSETGDGTAKLD